MWCSDNPWWRYVISNLISISFNSHLVIESTTIALLARLSGVLEPLREFVKQKPVWGTCAGAILLSQAVKGAKKGGQDLLGGMSITIARNGWGSQVRAYIWCILPCLNVKLDRIFWSWLMCARTPESWAAVYRIIHPCSGRWLYSLTYFPVQCQSHFFTLRWFLNWTHLLRTLQLKSSHSCLPISYQHH